MGGSNDTKEESQKVLEQPLKSVNQNPKKLAVDDNEDPKRELPGTWPVSALRDGDGRREFGEFVSKPLTRGDSEVG